MSKLNGVLERMIIARKSAGLSQSQLARLMGYHGTASTISDIETGKNTLSVECMLSYAALCEVSEVWLLTGINPSFDIQAFWEKVGPVTEAVREDMVKLANLLERSTQP